VPLAHRTERTITTPHALARHLAQVRSDGWALDDEESAEGLACVGTSVRLVFGRLGPDMGVSVSGLSSRMAQYDVKQLASELRSLVAEFEFATNLDPLRQGAS
jgi:IclR family acetate operon transcriptional repressor